MNVYVFETEDGDKIGVLGSTLLDARFENIEIGQKVAIEFLGERPGRSVSNTKTLRRSGTEGRRVAVLVFVSKEGRSSLRAALRARRPRDI